MAHCKTQTSNPCELTTASSNGIPTSPCHPLRSPTRHTSERQEQRKADSTSLTVTRDLELVMAFFRAAAAIVHRKCCMACRHWMSKSADRTTRDVDVGPTKTLRTCLVNFPNGSKRRSSSPPDACAKCSSNSDVAPRLDATSRSIGFTCFLRLTCTAQARPS